VVLLWALHKTRDPEPARLLIIAFTKVASNNITHECPVIGDGDFLRRNTETANNSHTSEGSAGCSAEGAYGGGKAWDSGTEGAGEHFGSLVS
jgi:hypothetical protein